MSSPWQKPQFNNGDYDSLPKENFALTRERKAKLTRFNVGAEGDGAIQVWTYSNPIGNGKHLCVPPGDSTVTVEVNAVAGVSGFARGEKVAVAVTRSGATIIGYPPGLDAGKANQPT